MHFPLRHLSVEEKYICFIPCYMSLYCTVRHSSVLNIYTYVYDVSRKQINWTRNNLLIKLKTMNMNESVPKQNEKNQQHNVSTVFFFSYSTFKFIVIFGYLSIHEYFFFIFVSVFIYRKKIFVIRYH